MTIKLTPNHHLTKYTLFQLPNYSFYWGFHKHPYWGKDHNAKDLGAGPNCTYIPRPLRMDLRPMNPFHYHSEAAWVVFSATQEKYSIASAIWLRLGLRKD